MAARSIVSPVENLCVEDRKPQSVSPQDKLGEADGLGAVAAWNVGPIDDLAHARLNSHGYHLVE
jgi:hypothetical protein